MKKNFIFISNWKTYLNFEEEILFTTKMYDQFFQLSEYTSNEIVLCPSFLSLHNITQIFKNTKINTGAQNCSAHSKGQHTGEVLAESLNLIGSKFCIIGHSETRKNFKESEEEISHKFEKLITNQISPIVAIGENKSEFDNNESFGILEKQLQEIEIKINENLKSLSYMPIHIAYEPTWAIGSGQIPDKDYLETIFAWLYKKLNKINEKINFKLLYGGSVNSENINILKNINHIDGFLVGKSSIDFKEFEKIVKSV